MRASYIGLLSGLAFSIVLVYLLIVVNFQSWLDPFIMISALPAALAGIAWFLFITHTTLSVPALMGAIMCMGVATSNSILVVSFATEKMVEGKDSVSAALEAGFTRFRPVLMTALAMIIGMVPMALGLGDGGEQNAPLGRAVIGGLLFATVSTLFFVPAFFSVLQGSRRPHAVETGAAAIGTRIRSHLCRFKLKIDAQTGSPTLPSNDAGDGTRSRKHWLILAIAAIAVSRSPGVGHLVPGQGSHHPKRGDRASGPYRRVGRIAKTNCFRPGDHPSWKCTAIHYFTHIFPHEWVPEEVVFRHRSARESKGNCLPSSKLRKSTSNWSNRSATCNTAKANLALAEITKNRYQGLLTKQCCFPTRRRQCRGHLQRQQGNRRSQIRQTSSSSRPCSLSKRSTLRSMASSQPETPILATLLIPAAVAAVKTDLFHIAQPGKLRVYVNVPEEYSQGIKVGMTADLTLAEFPGRKFQGKLVRTADAINVTTRTLLIEIEVDNPTGTLLTGSYAEVHLTIPTQASTFLLPVNALLFRSEGLHVGVVKDGKVVLTAVTPGHDFGNQIEIVSGLKADDQVIINPPDSIVSGQQVQIVQATLPGDTK